MYMYIYTDIYKTYVYVLEMYVSSGKFLSE